MTLLDFLAVFGRHNIRPPHFASKVSYSASPQTYAGVRAVPLAAMPHSLAICSKTSRIFLDFEHPTYLPLAAFANNHEDFVFQVVGKIDAAQLQ